MTDYNELFTFNDLSVDRQYSKRVITNIKNSTWTIDSRGTVYNAYNKEAILDEAWDGSLRVLLPIGNREVWRYVNALVLQSFNIPSPSTLHVPWHRDGDKKNCSLNNLSWVALAAPQKVSDRRYIHG